MWYQLNISGCSNEALDQLSDKLEETGALSIMLTDKNDNPVLEPAPGTTPLWPEVCIHALYATAASAEGVRKHLQQSSPMFQVDLEVLPDKDWERVCIDDFKPKKFGERLWICPTWSSPPDPAAVNLVLDPGLAFGTGSHPTTGLCLTWLEQASLEGKSVIDYGCGSGILFLAALKLGAERVFAADIDPQALQASQDNANINNLPTQRLSILAPEELQCPVDLIIANILLDPLISLKKRFSDLLKPQGILIVSGVLIEQSARLIQAYERTFKITTQESLDGWSLLVFKKNLSPAPSS
ncbi:MAG: 50S ribosomal protein L11 methyltransferase [Legionella sp.]|nr:50S ribosomal protein L11 methyltransferase [Legionella sp.]